MTRRPRDKNWAKQPEGEKLANLIRAAWPMRHDYSMVRLSLRSLIRIAKRQRDGEV